jgi:hypothetical protein
VTVELLGIRIDKEYLTFETAREEISRHDVANGVGRAACTDQGDAFGLKQEVQISNGHLVPYAAIGALWPRLRSYSEARSVMGHYWEVLPRNFVRIETDEFSMTNLVVHSYG